MKKLLGVLFTMCLFVFLLPSAFAETNAYVVENVYFTNLSGNVLENPTHSCVVNVEVTKQVLRFGNDDIVIASYATDGSLLGFTTVSGTIGMGETSIFRTLITVPADKTLGIVKAYVWNNILGMQPLSNENTVAVNEMGAEIISPIQEDYIPRMITVRGTIKATPRSDYSLSVGEYKLENMYMPIDYSNTLTEQAFNRYNAISDFYGIPLSQNGSVYTVKSEINLNDYLFFNGEFTLTRDEDNSFIILNFEPKASSRVVRVNAEDYLSSSDGGKNIDSYWKITFGSQDYKLYLDSSSYNYGIYVNGQRYNSISENTVSNILGMAQGEVTLVDIDIAHDGYEIIMATVYDISMVSSIDHTDGLTTIQVAPRAGLNPKLTSILFYDENIADGYTDITVKNDEGESIALSDIKAGDIIAYATPYYNRSGTMYDPGFIDIIATDKTVCGMVTSSDEERKTYTVDGVEYKEVVWGYSYLQIGLEHIIYLDPFDRICYADVMVRYAIAENTEKYDSYYYRVQLILPDGTAEWYELCVSSVRDYANITGAASYWTVNVFEFADYIENIKANSPAERIVKYTVSTDGIASIELVGGTASTFEYNADTAVLGSKTITDRTAVINACDYAGNISDYSPFSVSSFIDGTNYDAYVCSNQDSSNTAAFVVLTRIDAQ